MLSNMFYLKAMHHFLYVAHIYIYIYIYKKNINIFSYFLTQYILNKSKVDKNEENVNNIIACNMLENQNLIK